MEFIIASDVLQKILQKAVLLVDDSKKDTVLGHVLLQSEKNNLLLTVNGFDAEMRFSIPSPAQEAFERTFPAKKMNDICRTLPPDKDISIILEDDKISRIRCGLSDFTLNAISAEEFPSMHKEKIEAQTKATIDTADFYELVTKTHFSMAMADVRPMLNGLLFDFGKNSLKMVATDGHRLAYCNKKIDFGGEKRLQIILPRKIIERIERLLSQQHKEITIHASDRYIRIEQEDISLICRLIEGQYPDYEKVIPKVGDNISLSVDRTELIQALVRVGSLVQSEATAAARMKLVDGTMHLSTRSVMGEEAKDEIKVDYSGESIEISFNIEYMKRALENLPGEKVRMELRDAVSSFLLLPEESEDQKYVIMPMRI